MPLPMNMEKKQTLLAHHTCQPHTMLMMYHAIFHTQHATMPSIRMAFSCLLANRVKYPIACSHTALPEDSNLLTCPPGLAAFNRSCMPSVTGLFVFTCPLTAFVGPGE